MTTPHASAATHTFEHARARALPPSRPFWSRAVLALLRYSPRMIVAGLFLLAAVLKIINPADFAKDIQNYKLVPVNATHLLAMFIPWFEVTTALLLFIGRWAAAARLWIAIMLVGFTVAKFTLVARGLPLECGCFGKGNWLSDLLGVLNKGERGIWFNFGLMALLVIDFYVTRPRRPVVEVAPQDATAPAAPQH